MPVVAGRSGSPRRRAGLCPPAGESRRSCVLSAFSSAFKTPDLRKKILFTLGIIIIYRIGATLPSPGVSYSNIQACTQQAGTNGVFNLINLFSGGALLRLSVFALGIMPY